MQRPRAIRPLPKVLHDGTVLPEIPLQTPRAQPLGVYRVSSQQRHKQRLPDHPRHDQPQLEQPPRVEHVQRVPAEGRRPALQQVHDAPDQVAHDREGLEDVAGELRNGRG